MPREYDAKYNGEMDKTNTLRAVQGTVVPGSTFGSEIERSERGKESGVSQVSSPGLTV